MRVSKVDSKVTLKSKQPMKNWNNMNLNKYKRIKTIEKKCAELSHHCNLDIVCIIYDRKYNKFREIRTKDQITCESVHQMITNTSPTTKQPIYQRFLVKFNDSDKDEEQDAGVEQPDLELRIPQGLSEPASGQKDTCSTAEEKSSQDTEPVSPLHSLNGLKCIAEQMVQQVGQKRGCMSPQSLPNFAPKLQKINEERAVPKLN